MASGSVSGARAARGVSVVLRILASSALVAACSDARRRPIGGSCDLSADCESGLCYEGRCLDPGADEDGDGLLNGVEAQLGTHVSSADSDGDGIPDGAEVGDPAHATDSDGDQRIDAVESNTADADGDCLVDQLDPQNDTPAANTCSGHGTCSAAPGAAAAGPTCVCARGYGGAACGECATEFVRASADAPCVPSTCDTQAQDCGAADLKCTIVAVDPGATPLALATACVPTAAGQAGAECTRAATGPAGLGHDSCAAGLLCVVPTPDAALGHCRPLCVSSTDCTDDGGSCIDLDPNGPIGGFCGPKTAPAQCDDYIGEARTNGTKLIDPDGLGPVAPFAAECNFDLERGGWTRLSPAVVATLAAGDGPAREYLYSSGDAFYRSPPTGASWSETYAEAPGLWAAHRPTDHDSAFACAGGASGAGGAGGAGGVGCGPADPSGAGAELPRVLPKAPDGAPFDAEAGSVAVCQAPPDAFGLETVDGCADDVAVWVRRQACTPDPGSLLGDGALSVLGAATQAGASPCWSAWGPGGWMDHFAVDQTEVREGGTGPSLRAENPEVGNDIYALDLSQRHLAFIAGRAYRLGFWAKAAAPRAIRAFVQPVSLAYPIAFEDLTLDTSWRHYELAFDATKTSWDAQVDFQLAESSTAAVWLDDITVVDDGPSPCAGDASNLFGNGDFSAGRVCWSFSQEATHLLASAVVDPSAGPHGGPALVVKSNGPAQEGWWVDVHRGGLPLVGYQRYRLSFDARADRDRVVAMYVARFDLGLPAWFSAQPPIGASWRHYDYDFVLADDAPEGGAELRIDFGDAQAGTTWLANVRLEPHEVGGCGLANIDDNGFSNSSFERGTLCWQLEYDASTTRATMQVDANDETLPLAITIEPDTTTQADATRLTQAGFPLVAGRGYELRFRARGTQARQTYVAITDDGTTNLVRSPVFIDQNWKSFEFPFLVPTAPARARFELGLGGPGGWGTTRIDDLQLFDYSASSCTPADGHALANTDFAKGYLCWGLFVLDQAAMRLEAHADFQTFGLAAPSIRLDMGAVPAASNITFGQQGGTLAPQTTYELSFAAKAAAPKTIHVGVFDGTTGFLGQDVALGTGWQTYQFSFNSGSGSVPTQLKLDLQVGDPSGASVWLDDVDIQPLR